MILLSGLNATDNTGNPRPNSIIVFDFGNTTNVSPLFIWSKLVNSGPPCPKNILWLLGGINKKGDRLHLKKKDFKNVRAFIYGKNKKFFNKELKNKVKFKNFDQLSDALKNIFDLIEREKLTHNTILFSPCAASFDSFKNFEDRGYYFNQLIKKKFNGK